MIYEDELRFVRFTTAYFNSFSPFINNNIILNSELKKNAIKEREAVVDRHFVVGDAIDVPPWTANFSDK